MPDGLHPAGPSEIEHTIQSRAHRQAARIIMGHADRAELLAPDLFHLSCFFIVHEFRFPKEHVHTVGNGWRHLEVFEQGEVRQADLEVVGHAVLEPVRKAVLHEFGSLETDLVLQGGVIGERYLLVDAFLADPVLDLERIEPRDGKRNVRQCEGIGTVPGVLAVQGVDREVDLSAPVLGE